MAIARDASEPTQSAAAPSSAGSEPDSDCHRQRPDHEARHTAQWQFRPRGCPVASLSRHSSEKRSGAYSGASRAVVTIDRRHLVPNDRGRFGRCFGIDAHDAVFRLFNGLAHRYDLHTPAHHYCDDHAFVLGTSRTGGGRRILDVGCGTGVFLEKALAEGFDAHGINPSEDMVREASAEIGIARIAAQAMEDITDDGGYDGLCALSWVINYAADAAATRDILARFRRALRPNGRLLMQTAHAPNMDGLVLEDREPGSSGKDDDIVFLLQFIARGPDTALARYVYAAKSLGELAWEEHLLAVADAHLLGCVQKSALPTSRFTDIGDAPP